MAYNLEPEMIENREESIEHLHTRSAVFCNFSLCIPAPVDPVKQ